MTERQTVKIVEAGAIFVDYDGPVTEYQVQDDGERLKVTVWLPRPKPKLKPKWPVR